MGHGGGRATLFGPWGGYDHFFFLFFFFLKKGI